MAYILIVVSLACGGQYCAHSWPAVSMQRFETAKACQFAAAEISKRTSGTTELFSTVCVPEVIR